MKKKFILLTLISVLMILICTGCGKQNMDGSWVKSEIIEADGTVLTGDDIGPTEVYVIEGDKAWYSTTLEAFDKDVSMELAIIENDDKTYEFKILKNGELTRLALLSGVEFDKDKMTAKMYDESTFIFTRQK
jgi:hypothetical protein